MNFVGEACACLGLGDVNDQNLRHFDERVHRVIPFVGAGLSVPFGYPTWADLLRQITHNHPRQPEIESLITLRQFEEAADLIERDLPGSLASGLRTALDPARITADRLKAAAVQHLPRLSDGFVITTNFDAVLETAFARAGHPFTQVYPGTEITKASQVVHDNRHVLLKLHGTCERDVGRVLTLGEYRQQYTSDGEHFDRRKPLPSVLGQALGAYPMLFVGCSLISDRTMTVIADLVERLPGLTHFALLPESDNTVERRTQLAEWKIYPLFFKGSEYLRVERFLRLAAVRAEDRRRRRRPSWWPVGALLLLLAAIAYGAYAWAVNPAIANWVVSLVWPDPLELEKQRISSEEDSNAAAASFRKQAQDAGWEDAQVLHSWTGDFLVEHWIPRDVLVDALSRKQRDGQAGDLALGVWHERQTDSSTWNVAAGLTSPGERPAFLGRSFSIRSQGIEARSGPHRDTAGGLSSVTAAVVLGAYAGSFPPSLSGWICTMFPAAASPFVESVSPNPSADAAHVAGPPGCPALTFTVVRSPLLSTDVAKFRNRMNLQALEGVPTDTVYVSVAKVLGSDPLPVRVSLLWLKRKTFGAPVHPRREAFNLPDEPMLGFVEIPAGEFLMGSDPRRDKNAAIDELRQHTVTLPTYYMSRYEVTAGQFRAFLAATGRRPLFESAAAVPDDSPIEHVAWAEALAYARWLDDVLRRPPSSVEPLKALTTNCHVTLPSEAEWEKAARGVDGRVYPWGDQFDRANANVAEGHEGKATAIGSYSQGISPYGLYDMSGNVWEWTRSRLAAKSGQADFRYPYRPDDVDRERLDEDGVYRLLRGGSYGNDAKAARATARMPTDPEVTGAGVGFRTAISCATSDVTALAAQR